MEQNFYNIQKLLEKNAEYNILLGERSNGKSYQVKLKCLYEALTGCDYAAYLRGKKVKKTRSKFGYLRRWREEIKNKDVEDYFKDVLPVIPKYSGGMYDSIRCAQSRLVAYNSETDAELDIGRAFALTGVTHYKSLAYPDIGNIIYEEFITNSGYLGHEVESLYDLVSTIARRDRISVYMVGNTISRMCPYFREWELSHIKSQPQGTIDVYHKSTTQTDSKGKPIVIDIAVEYCANSGNNSKMFFGKSTKMITSGAWEAAEHQHLFDDYINFKVLTNVIYQYTDFCFNIQLLVHKDTNDATLYVCPYDDDVTYDRQRVITDRYTTSRLATKKWTKLTRYDIIMLEMLAEGKVCYSDNLTGTEFEHIKTERGGY